MYNNDIYDIIIGKLINSNFFYYKSDLSYIKIPLEKVLKI